MAAVVPLEKQASKAEEQHGSQPSDKAPETPKSGSAMGAYMRVFKNGTSGVYLIQAIGLIAACGSGTALAMVNLVLGSFINLLSDFTTGRGVPDNFMAKVSQSSLYFVYIGIARFACTYIYSVCLTYSALNFTRNIRHAYLRAALSQEVSFFDQGTAGSISMQATSNGKLIQSGTAEKLGQIFQAAATFIAAFIIAFVSQWKLTLILICIVPALLIIAGVAGTIDTGIETKILKIYAQAGSFAESVLGNVKATHAFSLAPRMVDRYSGYLSNARTLGNKKSILYGLMFGGEYFVIFAGMGLAFWQGFAMIGRGEVGNIGTVFTVVFSVIIAASMLNSVAPHMVTFSRAATAASELFALIDRPSDIDPFDKSGEQPQSVSGLIEIKDLSFSYPTRPDTKVLHDYTLQVPAGKVTALVGASGSGKSTIIGLLERWYNPSSGDICIDGKSIRALNLRWLRTNVRLVQQEPILFNGSVFDNICNGLVGSPWENAPREEKLQRVKAAARTAFAADFIDDLPEGYDTRIGERGGLLSGGQKQRIAIARSIISEPKILLLDEATSALDPHAEGIVQRALDEASKDRTTIVIAHKLKTIRDADNIVVMKQGRIVEQGRHEELVAMDGGYAKLVKAQDLAPSGRTADSDSDSDEQNEAELKVTKSLGRRQTGEMENLNQLKNREDFGLAQKTGLLKTIYKLVIATPEIKWWYVITVVTSIVGAGVYPGQAVLLGEVMDVFGDEDMRPRGNFFALMFFVMSLGLALVFVILGWATNVISQNFSFIIRKRLFQAMLNQDIRFYDRPENTIGSLTSSLDAYANSIFELMGFSIAIILTSVFTILVCGILSLVISWKLGLVGFFAGIPPMVLAGYVRIRVETKMDSDIDKKFSKSASVASETVTAIRTVSSLAIEEDVLERYTSELDNAIGQARAPLMTMMIFFAFTQAVEFFVLGLGFWWGSKLVSQGDITFYQFIVSFMTVYFSGQGCGILFSFASSFTKANSAANYFFWLTSSQPTIGETAANKSIGPSNGCKSYDFDNVQFSYPLAPNNRVLKGVSLKIKPGSFVAFVGASGCGKSTMISLLERYYDPTSGSINIDGNADLSTINPRLYRNLVSLVQQEPTLFPGTIRENIAMGIDQGSDATIDDEVIIAACRAANAWDFISSLPEGLATPCGSSGSALSGGQRQRIAIARALVRNPKVILLDEATSALDTESERVVQGALMDAAKSGDRITIAVAHRLSTIRDADRIFVFYGGRIVEAGTHGELLAQGGMYTKMCEAQSLDAAV